MAEQLIPPMVTSAHRTNRPLSIMVVGAGGTGGRLIPALMQVVRRGDTVSIVDGDHVEDRNLARQNFRTRDIGMNKAEVMANRYRRDGVTVTAYATMLTLENMNQIGPQMGVESNLILLGCVDSWRARAVMQNSLTTHNGSIWIDGGNERRGGQILFSANAWAFKVKAERSGHGLYEQSTSFSIPGLMHAMPQLLDAQPWHCHRCDVSNEGTRETCKKCKQPEESCQDRIDLQTVAVNQMSATGILNALTNVLYQVPFSNAGAFFSTLNTMSPIRLEKVDWDRRKIMPESTYAGTGVTE